jgi:serine/threonine-protein kinase
VDLRPGDRIEHFVIVATLGKGGMGQVYLARDTRLQRSVALKIMQPAPPGDSDKASGGAARLLREAQAAAALEHPNVVTVYEVGELHEDGDRDGCPFIAMELVKGKSLRAFVGDAAVPIRERVRWLTDVARALGAAHRSNLVHRDIKPENVMIRDDGVVKVLDFGLAKRSAGPVTSVSSTEAQVLPSLTAKGVAVGTPYYMAPEQMRREAVDGRADQFSWGVVAYELLSGQRTWGADVDALELVSKLLTQMPHPLGDVVPEVPRHVADAVMRALAKRREERFASTDDLVAALEGAEIALAPTLANLRVAGGTGTPGAPVGPAVADGGAGESPPPSRASAPAAVPRAGRTRLALYGVGVAAVVLGGGFLARSILVAGGAKDSAPLSASAPPATPARECTGHAACVRKLGGAPAACSPAGHCVLVENDRCHAAYEPADLARDDVVWIGAMFPVSGDNARWGVPNMNAVELARRDFAQATAGLRSAQQGAGWPPPLAVVACDDAQGSEESARHLVEDIGIPAVVGFGHGTIALATSTFVPRRVLTLSAITLSPQLSSIPTEPGHPRMVFRTTYNNASTARALAALIARVEAQLRTNHVLAVGDAMRVALVRAKDPSAAALAETLFDALVFNGKSALLNGDAYRELSIDVDQQAEQTPKAAAELATSYRPHVVVFATDAALPVAIEQAWMERSFRPIYLTNTPLADDLLAFVGRHPDRRQRVFGLASVSTTTPNARFVVHYNEVFADPIVRTLAPNSAYDAFYLAAYSSYAVAPEPIDGEKLARAIVRLLPPGTPVDVGPSGILSAAGALHRGEGIDFNGSVGRLDFDVATGDAPVDLAVLCARKTLATEKPASVEAGAIYDATSGKLVGDLACP